MRYGTLTLQSLFFFLISFLFSFCDFPFFFVRLPFLLQNLKGSAERKILVFGGVARFFCQETRIGGSMSWRLRSCRLPPLNSTPPFFRRPLKTIFDMTTLIFSTRGCPSYPFYSFQRGLWYPFFLWLVTENPSREVATKDEFEPTKGEPPRPENKSGH